MPRRPAHGDLDIFINCPFDADYQPILRAIVFTAHACGFHSRCTLEEHDSGEVRIERICNLIAQCRFAVHDISRIQLDQQAGFPRFNMPLELGLFLGARRFGPPRYAEKHCIILDAERFRYQQYCSDISGQDIVAHKNEPHGAVRGIRNWLVAFAPEGKQVASATRVCQRFDAFGKHLGILCAGLSVDLEDLTYIEYRAFVQDWLELNAL